MTLARARFPLVLPLALLLQLPACSDDGGAAADTDEAGEDGGSTAGGPGGGPGGGGSGSDSANDVDDCVPATCDELAWVCGAPDDGCGAALECGSCEIGDCEDGTCVFEPATHFDDEALGWSVPRGGENLAGFDAFAGSPGDGEGVLGRHVWSTADLNGDGLLDLVLTAEAVAREGYSYWPQVFGFDDDDPHWNVYLGTADGFANAPTRWDLPQGGENLSGFDALGGSPGDGEGVIGAHAWTTTDLSGDGIPDLVLTAEAVAREGYSYWPQVFGFDGDDPHWNVYLGTGEGFANAPTRWGVPQGGENLSGFDALGGSPGDGEGVIGRHAWTTVDLNGDRIPDLVLTAEAVAREGYSYWPQVFGFDDDTPHWNAYLGTGEGFANAPTRWDVPQGGENLSGFDALGGSPGDGEGVIGRHAWTTADLNGDRILDLVLTAEAVAREGYSYWPQVFGFGDDPHWNVYLGTDEGFANAPTRWVVPQGGENLSGFDALGGSPGDGEGVIGRHAWTTIDVDGDRLPDLVLTAEAVAREGYSYWPQVFGFDDGSPHWNVYRGTGEGFANAPTKWDVPLGGENLAGFDAPFGSPGDGDGVLGSHVWSTADINGDSYIDLVLTAEAVAREGYSYWPQVFGFDERTPRWHVFLGQP